MYMQQLQQLLRKYWNGKATESDRRQLLTMLTERGEEIKADLKKKFESAETDEVVLLNERASEEILKKIQERIRTAASSTEPPAKIIRFSAKSIGWAAAIIICIVSTIVAFQHIPVKKDQISARTPSSNYTPLKIIENKNAQPLRIALSDSSSVVLFPGSSLLFKEDFDSTYRSLKLTGKARFKVAKDTARPFTVYANGVATTALGTTFTVNTFSGPDKVHVRLAEGKVVIRSFFKNMRRSDIYLKPGQECMVDAHSREPVMSNYKTNNSRYATYKNTSSSKNLSSLVFDKETLSGIFEKLSRRFNTEIRYDKRALRNLSFTGRFNEADSLTMILTIICNTNDLFFEQNGAVITVRQ